jgi:UDP-N-acetyl-D-glucosamine dehydrogenase
MELLLEKGASISYSDPMVPEIDVSGDRYMSVELRPKIFGDFDLVMVLVGGDWPVAQAIDADVLVFDAVNASGSNQQGVHRL